MGQVERQQHKKSEDDFEEMHIAWMWEELHGRFGFPTKEWKQKFAEYQDQHPRERNTVSAFLLFGSAHIAPILNQILCRKEGYPTWNKLCDYVVQKKR